MFYNLISFKKFNRFLRVLCGFLFALAMYVPVHGQNASDLRVILRNTKSNQLLEMGERMQTLNTLNRETALQMAQEKGWPIRSVLENGTVVELQKLDAFGKPVYYTTHNVDAAETVSTDMLWPGGSMGFSLTGAGMTVGEWDGGAVLGTHNELIARVTQVDGATNYSDHATHVAGTMIASGVDPLAIGMAYQANLDAYEWISDDVEMATAASNGLLLSNHSYGQVTGWGYLPTYDILSSIWPWIWLGEISISTMEDYAFGYYDDQAQVWDDIAYNSPYYLIVKSAGNDRGEGPAPGTRHRYINGQSLSWSTATRDPDGKNTGYDCISSSGLAKNVLTVGAVDDIAGGYSQASDVLMSSFSSWGPTDDGRIKPDICGNGIGLYSPFSDGNNSYGTYSGTSMASPNVTGSLLLLQQHYNVLHPGNFMRASTLKALAIHTADEAGSEEGPDYKFGWGLLNAAKAAQVISSEGTTSYIREVTLQNNKTYSFSFYADGSTPIKATICWTDSAGMPVAPQLNPTDLMLVNDLDVRITKNDTIYYPFVLNPSSPASAATKGDNFRDNVEQVYIDSATEGIYTMTITHKGELAGGIPQHFSIILTGAEIYPSPPTIAFFTPDSGPAGESVTITGSGFLDVTSVTIGGKSARHYFVESGTKIIADVSSTGATGDVVVETAYGSGNLSGFTFSPNTVDMSSVIVDGSANDPNSPLSTTFVNWFPVENAVEYEVYARGELVTLYASSANFWAELSNFLFDVNDDLKYALKVRAKLEDGSFTNYSYPSESIPVNTSALHGSYLRCYANKKGIFFMNEEAGIANISIYTLSGQEIVKDAFTGLSYQKNYELKKGVYVVKVDSKGNELVEKIIIKP